MKKQLKTLLSIFLLCLVNVSFAEVMPNASQKPLIVAHYMAWFGLPEISGQWYQWKFVMPGLSIDKQHDPDYFLANGRRDIAAVHYPSIGPYDSTDSDALEYHILLAKEAGIDGFMVNWYGFQDNNGRRHEDRGFEQLLKVAERLNFKVCINYDDKCSFVPYRNSRTREEAVNFAKINLQQVMERYAPSSAYLRIDGRPVISNFGWWYVTSNDISQTSFSPAEWKDIIDYLKAYRPFFIHDHQYHWKKSIEQAGFLTSADSIFPWIGVKVDRISFLEESQKLLKEGKIKMITGIANPGFDNNACQGWGGGINVIPRREGQEYRDNLDEDIQYNAGFIQIVTWNDFTEGSTIEPTEEYGDLYLKITSEYANRWSTTTACGESLYLPKKIYFLRKLCERLNKSGNISSENLSEIDRGISNVIGYLLAHDRLNAEKSLEQAQLIASREEKKAPPDENISIVLSPSSQKVISGAMSEFTVHVNNPYDKELSAVIRMECAGIPRGRLVESEKTVFLKAHEEKDTKFTITVPEDNPEMTGRLTASIFLPQGKTCSNIAYIYVISPFLRFNIGPVNLLHSDREEKLYIKFANRNADPGNAEISFAAPDGWHVDPASISKRIPQEGQTYVPFTVKIPKEVCQSGTLKIFVALGGKKYTIQEPYAVIPENGVKLLEGDVDQDGSVGIVLGNKWFELRCTPSIGGRIVAMIARSTGNNQLFLGYPAVARTEGESADKWAEYGGINDTFPHEWPGSVWNNDWDYRTVVSEDTAAVIFTTKTEDDILIRKEIVIYSNSPFIELRYDLQNEGDQTKEIFWSNHPDLAPGNSAGPEDIYFVPAKIKGSEELVKRSYSPSLEKIHYIPAENWFFAYDSNTGEYLGQVFDRSLIEKVGIWEGKNFFTMEQISGSIILKPKQKKNFVIKYIVGQGKAEDVIKTLRSGNNTP